MIYPYLSVVTLKSGETCKISKREFSERGRLMYRLDCLSGQWRSGEFWLTGDELAANDVTR